jgi:hypothetical protein
VSEGIGFPVDFQTLRGWDKSTLVEKESLSLDREIVAKARRIAGPKGLSPLVNDALRLRLQQKRLRALLAAMDAEFGPVRPQDLKDAQFPDGSLVGNESTESIEPMPPSTGRGIDLRKDVSREAPGLRREPPTAFPGPRAPAPARWPVGFSLHPTRRS